MFLLFQFSFSRVAHLSLSFVLFSIYPIISTGTVLYVLVPVLFSATPIFLFGFSILSSS